MRTISMINLKGGVAKTVSAINIAHILATVHHKRVLLVDNDKQGNTSRFFNHYSYEEPSISELLTNCNLSIQQVIKHTNYQGLDLIPSNMGLLTANKMLTIDNSLSRNERLRTALKSVENCYDYCIIDNAPDLNMSVINALVATDDVLVPIKVDQFAFDGLEHLTEQVEDVKAIHAQIKIVGCFITMYSKNNVNIQGGEFLVQSGKYPLFDTRIRKTVKVDEMTFQKVPLLEYAKRSTATLDYLKLVEEYLGGNVSETDTK